MTIDPAASGPDTHLEPDRMADLYEGLLEPGAAEAARRHLAGCRACADDFALITLDSGFGGELAAFTAPEPIPADVAIRIEAALHREPPLAVPAAAPQHSAAPRRSRRFRLWFGGLAGATLVIGGVFAGVTALNSGGAKSSSVSVAGGAADSGRSTSPHAASSPAAGAQAPNAVAPPSDAESGSPQGSATLTVEQQAAQLLKKAGQSQPQAAGSTGDTKALASRFACPPAGFADTSPLGMASITYQGQPAELLVYPKPGDATTASVYVVATTGCAAPGPGEVLYTTEVPRR
ncbi:hypothetical protein [Catenulispora subtropica]|uniref:Zinc-finger domain-containing protein n=1 Tax=Catenulispora subtropica TaxID=450798 RepID=A0ABN2QVI7_9ACTN